MKVLVVTDPAGNEIYISPGQITVVRPISGLPIVNWQIALPANAKTLIGLCGGQYEVVQESAGTVLYRLQQLP